jgi:hypothetical protein
MTTLLDTPSTVNLTRFPAGVWQNFLAYSSRWR